MNPIPSQPTPGMILKWWHVFAFVAICASGVAWFSFRLSIVEADNTNQSREIDGLQAIQPTDNAQFVTTVNEINTRLNTLETKYTAMSNNLEDMKKRAEATDKKIDDIKNLLIQLFGAR